MKTIDKARDRENIYIFRYYSQLLYICCLTSRKSTTDMNLSKYLNVMIISLTKVHIFITKLLYEHIWVINGFHKIHTIHITYPKTTYIFLGRG